LTQKRRAVTLELTDFILPAEDLPDEIARAVKHWSQWIDYWAVDWNYRNDTFHNEWQTYRTRERGDLELRVQNEYKEPGSYSVVVKVIDILGNDTTKVIPVQVK
jgi:adenine-specific DNA-methyltransferase